MLASYRERARTYFGQFPDDPYYQTAEEEDAMLVAEESDGTDDDYCCRESNSRLPQSG